MPPGSGAFALQETTITVEGDGEMTFVSFSHLSINQQLADTNSFSFIWRTERGENNFSVHVDFYRANLGKEVTISVGDTFTFKGFIHSITCVNQGATAITNEYHISGKGLFAKLDEVEECNSFYHKNLSDIFNTLNTTQNTTLNLDPVNTSELFYHVQYNSTTFNFYRMLAARYGEWFYYTGEQMVLASPGGDVIELVNGRDVMDLQINAAIRKAGGPAVGYDQYSGEILQNTTSAESGSGVTGISTEAAETAFGSEHRGRRVSTAPTSELLREMNTLLQRAATASTVYLEGSTHNASINLGKKIRIADGEGNSEGEYIITQVVHSAYDPSNYQNHFVAVPADVQVPPYTNPLIYPVCFAQQATVVDNVDADGLDRIKVRFPWMQDTETSPWISVMVPYAGNGRGMRFIPEIDEEVMVDFVDNNAERPIMIGSFYTTANTSGVPHEGNNVKVFGTRSGRRLEVNDDSGEIRISDHDGSNPGNKISLKKNDESTHMALMSGTDSDNFSVLQLENSKGLLLTLLEAGQETYTIQFLKDEKKLKIYSKEKIEIISDKDIEINAGQSLKLTSGAGTIVSAGADLEMSGTNIKAEADATIEMKGASAKFEGSVDATLKAGAMLTAEGGAIAELKGALVKIN